MFATALALLSGAFSGRERGTAFAYFGATTGVAVAVGPVLGGVLTSGLSWHWIFWVNIPICFFALAVTLTKVTETRDPHPGRLDLIGFLTWSSGLGLLVLALIRGGVDGWGDPLVVGSFVASAVLLVAFVVSQLLQDSPMFDLGLLRKPTFVGGLIAAFGVSASVFSLLTYLVIYVQNVLGYSPVEAGVRFLCLSGMSFISAIIAGRLTSFVPTKWLIAPGFFVTALGLYLLTGITVDSEWTHLVPGLIVSGLGIGLINVPLASTAVGVVRPERAGMASGVNSTFRQVGIATGIAALGSIFATHVASGISSALAGTPAAGRSEQVADAVTNGQIKAVLAQAPAGVRDTLGRAATSSFVDALNHITYIAAAIALVSGLLCLVPDPRQGLREPRWSAGPTGTGRGSGEQQLDPDDVAEDHDQCPEHGRGQPAADVGAEPAADDRPGRDQADHRPVERRVEHEHHAGRDVGGEHRDVLQPVDRLQADVEPESQHREQQHALGGAEVAAVHPDEGGQPVEPRAHPLPVGGHHGPAARGPATDPGRDHRTEPDEGRRHDHEVGHDLGEGAGRHRQQEHGAEQGAEPARQRHPDHQGAVPRELAAEAEGTAEPARDETHVVADVRHQRGQSRSDQDREAHE